MTEFIEGKRYFMRAIGDHNCIWTYTVERRSAKSVFLRDDGGRRQRCAIRVWEGVETCRPHGSYSMAPTLSADKPTEHTAAELMAAGERADERARQRLLANRRAALATARGGR